MQVPINDVLTMLSEVLEETPESISPDRKLDSIEGWDSVGVLTLMAELDDQYEIMLDADEIQNFSTVSDILATLKKKGVEIIDQ